MFFTYFGTCHFVTRYLVIINKKAALVTCQSCFYLQYAIIKRHVGSIYLFYSCLCCIVVCVLVFVQDTVPFLICTVYSPKRHCRTQISDSVVLNLQNVLISFLYFFLLNSPIIKGVRPLLLWFLVFSATFSSHLYALLEASVRSPKHYSSPTIIGASVV